jgi:hypothetical protein
VDFLGAETTGELLLRLFDSTDRWRWLWLIVHAKIIDCAV